MAAPEEPSLSKSESEAVAEGRSGHLDLNSAVASFGGELGMEVGGGVFFVSIKSASSGIPRGFPGVRPIIFLKALVSHSPLALMVATSTCSPIVLMYALFITPSTDHPTGGTEVERRKRRKTAGGAGAGFLTTKKQEQQASLAQLVGRGIAFVSAELAEIAGGVRAGSSSIVA